MHKTQNPTGYNFCPDEFCTEKVINLVGREVFALEIWLVAGRALHPSGEGIFLPNASNNKELLKSFLNFHVKN